MKSEIINPIATIHTDFPQKFGIPRQSGMIEELKGTIIFEKEYQNPDALRGLEGFSHLWLLWLFDDTTRDKFVPTVRPPRLGGSERMGVFATRSPFRPNPIGLSCVKLDYIENTNTNGNILHVLGADMKDGTRIIDIKPYLPFVDSYPEAAAGYITQNPWTELTLHISEELLALIPAEKRESLLKVLKMDPRSANKKASGKECALYFADLNVKFSVENNILTVLSIETLH